MNKGQQTLQEILTAYDKSRAEGASRDILERIQDSLEKAASSVARNGEAYRFVVMEGLDEHNVFWTTVGDDRALRHLANGEIAYDIVGFTDDPDEAIRLCGMAVVRAYPDAAAALRRKYREAW